MTRAAGLAAAGAFAAGSAVWGSSTTYASTTRLPNSARTCCPIRIRPASSGGTA